MVKVNLVNNASGKKIEFILPEGSTIYSLLVAAGLENFRGITRVKLGKQTLQHDAPESALLVNLSTVIWTPRMER